jgi:hypothetical protein
MKCTLPDPLECDTVAGRVYRTNRCVMVAMLRWYQWVRVVDGKMIAEDGIGGHCMLYTFRWALQLWCTANQPNARWQLCEKGSGQESEKERCVCAHTIFVQLSRGARSAHP